MKDNDIKQSMSKAGCPFDNAVSENMFKLLKTEGVDSHYHYPEDLVTDVDEWVKWYNIVRVHSTLNYVSPRIYRENYSQMVV